MINIRPLVANDYAVAIHLWRTSEGVVLRSDDSYEAFVSFIERNPGLSLGAWSQTTLVGAVMAGHDARRAYLYHLAVAQQHRRSGMGRQLIETVLAHLKKIGVLRLHIFVEVGNEDAEKFWQSLGWHKRPELIPESVTSNITCPFIRQTLPKCAEFKSAPPVIAFNR